MSLVDLKPQTLYSGDEVFSILKEDGTLDKAREPKLPDADLLKLYRTMVLTRLFDSRMVTLQRQGRISFYLPSPGEEAAVVGAAYALADNDWIFPCYRESAAAFWRGITAQTIADQCFGNTNDINKGRQMPVHWGFASINMGSVSSPIATQIPHAVGMAWGSKLKGGKDIALTYFGEGATSHPDFHNGMNMAGVLKAPVILLCRNNGWAISTPRELQTAAENFAIKGLAYGVEGLRVDGNDLLAVIVVCQKAAEKARNGGGATLIEAVTYRMSSHSTSDDPSVYRNSDDLAVWEPRDPIGRFRKYLETKNLWSAAKEEALVAEIKAEIEAAVQKAESTPPPAVETLFDDVYSQIPPHLQAQKAELLAHLQSEAH
ncbi:MAG: thiamine pyrophosphate-dependent dehydrogenase E1 component subunit alpha [Candidatus Sericytochromatia bacterium]|nr:thiamine pyrophosphate-dependent dehydrogenase E1 component subunit alpha [Candidatus Sericytochromatia bacterium]